MLISKLKNRPVVKGGVDAFKIFQIFFFMKHNCYTLFFQYVILF